MPDGKVTYVVAVHGMGEPKRNETVTRLVEGMERARRQRQEDLRSRARRAAYPAADGRAGLPWLNYDAWGENVRFADFWWSDVTRAGFDEVGQRTEKWGDTVLDRLEGDSELGVKRGPASPTAVALIVNVSLNAIKVLRLGSTVSSLLTQHNLELPKEAFDSTLGDVQVYAENETVRLQAIRKFDSFMQDLIRDHVSVERARVQEGHATEKEKVNGGITTERGCRVVIVAHSLGSVLAIESILRASYQGGLPATPGTAVTSSGAWVERVDALVAFGSPIDKFMTIWPENFNDLNDPTHWSAESVEWCRRPMLIEHYHLTDALDVIADEGTRVEEMASYDRVFRLHRLTFASGRYPVYAHVEYWLRERLSYALVDAIAGKGPAWSEGLEQAAGAEPWWRAAFSVIFRIPLLLALLVAVMVGLTVVTKGVLTTIGATAAAVLVGAIAACFIDATAWAGSRLDSFSSRTSWPVRWLMTIDLVFFIAMTAMSWIAFARCGGLPADIGRFATIVLTVVVALWLLHKWGWKRTTVPTWSLVPMRSWIHHVGLPLAGGIAIATVIAVLRLPFGQVAVVLGLSPEDTPGRGWLQLTPSFIYVGGVGLTAFSATLLYDCAQRLIVAELTHDYPATKRANDH